jgi:anti-sigma factor RsiW
MKIDPPYERLLELSWKRKLTEAESAELRAWLAAHPEAQARWEAETALNEALAGLPEAPVPSNFTARVLQASARAAAAESRPRLPAWRGLLLPARWLPRVGLAAIVLGSGVIAYHQAQASRRYEVAKSLVTMSDVPSLPSPKILEDYDAIRAMSSTPAADEQLLDVLAKLQ